MDSDDQPAREPPQGQGQARRQAWRQARRGHVLTWLALLALLALTAGSAWLPLGVWNGALNLAIALAKAALVGWRYMALRRDDGVPRLVAATGLATVLLLLGLTAADYGTRVLRRAPWQVPPSASRLTDPQWREGK